MSKKLTLLSFLAAMTMGLTGANAALSLEAQQNVEYYMGAGPCPMAAAPMVMAAGPCCNAPCAAPCPCPMECPCVPGCCPAIRGLFDGGMCCGGRAVPPICGC